jgi:hypothetical protein
LWCLDERAAAATAGHTKEQFMQTQDTVAGRALALGLIAEWH